MLLRCMQQASRVDFKVDRVDALLELRTRYKRGMGRGNRMRNRQGAP